MREPFPRVMYSGCGNDPVVVFRAELLTPPVSTLVARANQCFDSSTIAPRWRPSGLPAVNDIVIESSFPFPRTGPLADQVHEHRSHPLDLIESHKFIDSMRLLEASRPPHERRRFVQIGAHACLAAGIESAPGVDAGNPFSQPAQRPIGLGAMTLVLL